MWRGGSSRNIAVKMICHLNDAKPVRLAVVIVEDDELTLSRQFLQNVKASDSHPLA
jgi:hypothetical protein